MSILTNECEIMFELNKLDNIEAIFSVMCLSQLTFDEVGQGVTICHVRCTVVNCYGQPMHLIRL